MDPPFLNLGLQPQVSASSNANSNALSALQQLNGLDQNSKLSFVNNHSQQQTGPVYSLNSSNIVSGLPKALAEFSLDPNRKTIIGSNPGTDSSSSVNSISCLPLPLPTTPFHSFSSSSSNLISTNHCSNQLPNVNSCLLPSVLTDRLSSNNSNLTTIMASDNVINQLPNSITTNSSLASQNFSALNNCLSSNASLQYPVALRSSPTNTPPRPGSPLSLPQHCASDRMQRLPSPSEQQCALPTFQKHIGGTTYFYSAQELALLGARNHRDESSSSLSGLLSSEECAAAVVTPVTTNSNNTTVLAFPNYAVAPVPPSHIHHLTAPLKADNFFVQDDVKRYLLEKQILSLAQLPPNQYPDIPQELETYEDLMPLDKAHVLHKSSLFGYPTSVYKATQAKSGIQYCLYRVHGYCLNNVKVTQIVDMWKKLQHSGFVQLREVFTTKAFGDNSIIFVYDYHAGAETLCSKFSANVPLTPGWETVVVVPPVVPYTTDNFQQAQISTAVGPGREMLCEAMLWNMIIQLTGALRAVHSAGLACRVLDPSKVLLTDNRKKLRLNCCGILDVLHYDPNAANPMGSVPHNQQGDLAALGKLLLGVCLRACVAGTGMQRDKMQTALELVQRTYSRDLCMLITCLLTQQRIKTINDVMPMIGARFYTAVETATQLTDLYENELSKELQNGRLFRLIVKLSTIVDRPHVNNDSNWCETGDRYMLKLFRDYLFYQTMEDGRPYLDLGHVVSVLNKLDAGSHDQLMLMAHDGQNVLVTSYHELKTCFSRAFNELLQSTASSHKLS